MPEINSSGRLTQQIPSRPRHHSSSPSHTRTPTFSGFCTWAKALGKDPPGPTSATPYPPLMDSCLSNYFFSLSLKRSQDFKKNKKQLLKGKNWIPLSSLLSLPWRCGNSGSEGVHNLPQVTQWVLAKATLSPAAMSSLPGQVYGSWDPASNRL